MSAIPSPGRNAIPLGAPPKGEPLGRIPSVSPPRGRFQDTSNRLSETNHLAPYRLDAPPTLRSELRILDDLQQLGANTTRGSHPLDLELTFDIPERP